MSDQLASKTRFTKYASYAVWFGLFLVVASFATYFVYREYSRYNMKALNCEKVSTEEFESLLSGASQEPMYTANPNKPTSPVTFHFNFPYADLSDAIFVVHSYKAHGDIYRAQYKYEFVVQAGKDLFSHGGGDTFEFSLFNKKTHEVCVGVHESEPFWQANKKVYFDLLPERELNELELPVSFKVRIE